MQMVRWSGVGALVLGGVACSAEVGEQRAPGEESAAEPASTAPSAVADRLERAVRAVDRQEDLPRAKAELEALITEPSATRDQKDEAALGLSRALELSGDHEGAVEALEELLGAHGDAQFPAFKPAERRLRLLLTGKPEGETLRLPRATPLPPMASALAKLYERDGDGRVLVDMAIFGSTGRPRSDAFDAADAKRDEYGNSVQSTAWVGQSITQSGSWTSLPQTIAEKRADMPQADRSLLVFYYDLEDNRVPSHYDAYLPIPSEDIAAALQSGDGLVVARERKGGKPTIVIAAPRPGQLFVVEDAFAKLDSLPLEPLRVELTEGLQREEIQARVRTVFPDARRCFEELLGRDPKANGKVDLTFVIRNDGTIDALAVGPDSTLGDATLQTCILDATRKLRFPAFQGKTVTVKYPIAFSP